MIAVKIVKIDIIRTLQLQLLKVVMKIASLIEV